MTEKISIQNAALILEALASHGSEGCGVISLSMETGVNKAKLRYFLMKNKDFAIPVYGKSKFKINKFGPQKGSIAEMIETMQHHGADSFAGRLASVMQGSTETTFYVLAVYLGAVGIKHSRYAVGCCLAADGAGIFTAIAVSYWFFG